ncbi:uncharacterized protein J4E92_009061 [Alternaria infectoria]|uniref:uncharacterized protein n=1 Tax=Alternaria ventricosa TaxID=1187951 RepID=UPI0020C36832|nr:uncharacterized protein J4E93_002788 [Alternaria ventricosa]XP_051349498.1 uncharacterized protein J4E92_009061 [Alternaria infectoria]KAI4650432.1 hypothetical protein J4E93_002788 [Alternaria ventricosa]KAI4917667.1 hypothetical protein J4E92_009061 [Alternaria infectoria]
MDRGDKTPTVATTSLANVTQDRNRVSKRVRRSASPDESPQASKRPRKVASQRQQTTTKMAEALSWADSGSGADSGAFEPDFQDGSDEDFQQGSADDLKQTQTILHPPMTETLSRVEQTRLLSPRTSSLGSDSQHQQMLYHLLRDSLDSEHIVAEINRYRKEGKQLPWFQQIIPGLRPGVEGNATWLLAARETLWDEEEIERHKEICERNMMLGQILPELPVDEYGLRRPWPSIIEGLQPISLPLAIALDQVSCLLARGDCKLLDPTGNWLQTAPSRTQESNNQQDGDANAGSNANNQRDTAAGNSDVEADQTYVVMRQAIQDKILSPIIDDLSSKLNNLTGGDSMQVKRKEELREGLRRLRAVIITEKDARDSARD